MPSDICVRSNFGTEAGLKTRRSGRWGRIPAWETSSKSKMLLNEAKSIQTISIYRML